MFDDYGLAKEAQGQVGLSQPRRFSLTERLEAEKRTLTDRLAQVDKVLEALKAQPSFQELFDLISRTL